MSCATGAAAAASEALETRLVAEAEVRRGRLVAEAEADAAAAAGDACAAPRARAAAPPAEAPPAAAGEAASAKERSNSFPSCIASWSPRGLASAPQPSEDTSQQEVAPPGTWCSRYRG